MATQPQIKPGPGRRIRVLVVDDSVVIRRLITSALEADPEIEVVGTAANGSIALQRIPQVSPDVLTLDIEMPEMDGMATLKELRIRYPHIKTIMCSTLTERGAAVTIDALALGANDYIAKSAKVGALQGQLDPLRHELSAKVKQFFRTSVGVAHASPEPPKIVSNSVVKTISCTRRILTIGVSTGGPNALAEVIPQIPADYPLPVLIVQHMPPVFTRLLAERLNARSTLRVEEAADGALVEPGRVYIAPGDFHMHVRRQGAQVRIALNQGPPENSCRPAVDVMLRSVADVYDCASINVILTGMGQDGLRGIETLKSLGAYVIAQDEASSVVWGMPGFVVKAGLADRVADLRHVVPEILRETASQHAAVKA